MGTEKIEETTQSGADALSSVAVARRRMLLKGAGKGVAVMAATVPIQTLAGQSLLTFDGKHQCSVSGMQSGVHSATPTNTPVCGGYSISYWKNNAATAGIWPINSTTRYSPTLTKITLTGNPTMLEVLTNFATSDEAHWVCAYLNALKVVFNFPYTSSQVQAYNGSSGATYTNALAFFTNFMETHTS